MKKKEGKGKRIGTKPLQYDRLLLLRGIQELRKKTIVVDGVAYLCEKLLDWRKDMYLKYRYEQLDVLEPIGLFMKIEQGNPRAAQVIKERLWPRPPRSIYTFCHWVDRERLDALEAELKGRGRSK